MFKLDLPLELLFEETADFSGQYYVVFANPFSGAQGKDDMQQPQQEVLGNIRYAKHCKEM